MIKLQSDMLRLIALGTELHLIGDEICRRAEAAGDGALCSILTYDQAGRSHLLSAPSVPRRHNRALAGLEGAAAAGSREAAASRRDDALAARSATDPLGEIGRHLALPPGFEGCWSSPVFAEDGRLVATFAFHHDVGRSLSEHDRTVVDTCVDLCTIAIRHQEALAHVTRLAYADPLTGLLNRAAFERFVSERLESAEDGTIAVHYIDLDDFKTINDTLGHRAGDLLVVELARRLEQAVGDGEAVARLGGDEFAVCSPGGDPDRQQAIARAVLAAFAQPVAIAGREVRVATSIGIAQATPSETTAHQLMRNADLALYQAKSAGKNTWRFFSERTGAEIRSRNELRADLRMAILRNELQVWYQPILNVVEGKVQAFEALLRWTHASRGPISPVVFIPLAEESGLIAEIGLWVLDRALADAAAWPADIAVSVNVSPTQLRRPSFALEVARALAQSGMPPSRLGIEITETVLFDDTDTTLKVLGDLQALGASIALDDFGTGYSSLSLLRNRRFCSLKIDKSFVDGLNRDPDCEAIVNGLIDIARSLRIHITAEGVETTSQFDWLESRGCESIQGYLIGRPIPVGDIDAFLQAFGQHAPASRASARA